MNKINLNRKRLICIVLIIISLILLLLGFYHISVQNKYIKNGHKTFAIVENILKYPDSNSETYDEDLKHYKELIKYYQDIGVMNKNAGSAIIIAYEFEGKEYLADLNYFSSEIRISQILTIYLSEDDPTDFIYEGENKFGLYFCMIVGTCLLIGSVAFFFIQKYNNKINIKLVKEGKVLEAEVLYADENENKTSFNKHPFIFTCLYKNLDTNEEKIFTSDSLYCKKNGLEYIGEKVKVYVDPNDYDNYYVDAKQFEK